MSTILEYRKDGPIEILPDGTIVRHSEILPDSTTLRVNLNFMDGLDDIQRSVALSSQVRDRISNTALHDGLGRPAGHKPGYVFAGPPLVGLLMRPRARASTTPMLSTRRL